MTKMFLISLEQKLIIIKLVCHAYAGLLKGYIFQASYFLKII